MRFGSCELPVSARLPDLLVAMTSAGQMMAVDQGHITDEDLIHFVRNGSIVLTMVVSLPGQVGADPGQAAAPAGQARLAAAASTSGRASTSTSSASTSSRSSSGATVAQTASSALAGEILSAASQVSPVTVGHVAGQNRKRLSGRFITALCLLSLLHSCLSCDRLLPLRLALAAGSLRFDWESASSLPLR